MKLLKWILIGGAIAWVWNRMRGTQSRALPASSTEPTSTGPQAP
jgi:hypothetical protein